MMKFVSPLSEIREPKGEVVCEEVAGMPENASPAEFLTAVYRDPGQPIGRRLTAAIAASKIVIANEDRSKFGQMMEQICRQSGKSNVIDAKANYKTPQALPIQADPEGRKR
jgi:hypothetical protein